MRLPQRLQRARVITTQALQVRRAEKRIKIAPELLLARTEQRARLVHLAASSEARDHVGQCRCADSAHTFGLGRGLRSEPGECFRCMRKVSALEGAVARNPAAVRGIAVLLRSCKQKLYGLVARR